MSDMWTVMPSPVGDLRLVTDGWADGWVARAREGSVQPEYEVLPADYVVRAVPLAAGSHRLRLEYRAPGWRAGAWISMVALLVGLVFTVGNKLGAW